MPAFYFDTHRGNDITIDDEGIELADRVAVETLALEALGQAILDDAREHRTGVTKIEVRDAASQIVLRASAAVSIERLGS